MTAPAAVRYEEVGLRAIITQFLMDSEMGINLPPHAILERHLFHGDRDGKVFPEPSLHSPAYTPLLNLELETGKYQRQDTPAYVFYASHCGAPQVTFIPVSDFYQRNIILLDYCLALGDNRWNTQKYFKIISTIKEEATQGRFRLAPTYCVRHSDIVLELFVATSREEMDEYAPLLRRINQKTRRL